MARTVGLKDQGQSLHHFLKEAEWKVEDLRETRLWLTKLLIGEREVVLLIDETGDEKKGKTTDYIVMSAYLLVSLQANYFQLETLCPFKNESIALSTSQLSHHPLWEEGINWKSALNNLRLIIQPYTFYNLLQPWLEVFKIPKFRRCFFELIEEMNQFLGFSCFGFSNFSLFPFLAA